MRSQPHGQPIHGNAERAVDLVRVHLELAPGTCTVEWLIAHGPASSTQLLPWPQRGRFAGGVINFVFRLMTVPGAALVATCDEVHREVVAPLVGEVRHLRRPRSR